MENIARTENGALSYATSLSVLVDQFGQAATFRGRSIDDVFSDQSKLWDEDEHFALRFPFYLRMVTRKVNFSFEEGVDKKTDKIQKGQGCKDEAFKRYLWLSKYHKNYFERNLWAIPVIGSWKDVWMLLYYNEKYSMNAIDKLKLFALIQEGIGINSQRELIKKYLPRIRSNKKCKSEWSFITNKLAKELCSFLGWSEPTYRRFKSTGIAHRFQKTICKRMFDDINFNEIPGRALSLLTDGKFLKKHKLVDAYTKFIESQPVAKFTGYPFELMKKVNDNMPIYKKLTIDKQFEQLLNSARDNGKISENVLCCLDTSGSMGISVTKGTTALDIATSLAIYFSSLNTGQFKDKIIGFDDESRLISLDGSFTDKISQIEKYGSFMGSTNFQSVIDELVRVRKENPTIPISDYPTTILAVSDMQFNTSTYNWEKRKFVKTNLDTMLEKLSDVFPQSYVRGMKFIWWQVTDRTHDVPATINDPGNILISGFDGAIISMILGGDAYDQKEKTIPNMEDVVKDALNQEILTLIN